MDRVAPPLTCITSLPVEILLGIFYFLDVKAVLRCCSVCRLWQETVESSVELKYIIELWADGLVPSYRNSLSPVEKLDQLHKWRRAWQSLDWTSQSVFQIGPNPRAYELVGGVFAQHITWPESDFTAIRLPTAETRAQISSQKSIGVESLDFAMDPTQDLVVFLHQNPERGNFECRSLSTLATHPLAFSPRLSFDLGDGPLRRIFLQVADDVVGLLFRTTFEHRLRLIIINWRTGAALVDLASPELPPAVSDFALLSPRTYILGSLHDSRHQDAGGLHIFTFAGTHSDHPTHVATLQLPTIQLHRQLERIIMHSGPFCALPIKESLFSKSNDRRICVISLQYNRFEQYTLYVHHRHFEKYLGNNREYLIIPWDEWGNENSRLLPGKRFFWLRYVHGERVVCPVDSAHPKRVEVLDFGLTPSRAGFEDRLVTSEPSTVCNAALFENDITTSLPYRRVSRHMDDQHYLFMIDQNRLIAVNEAVDRLTVYAF
ncbi:hypothetical protein K438DRAFT_1824018 [Mycena galopus ATCC 62051]|nr:hypothetical protein K438DRAFT_1824018 [Mycena galopus ATCC 62051]